MPYCFELSLNIGDRETGSDGCVDTHQEVEDSFNAVQEVLSVVDIEVEFSLNRVVDKDASLDIDLVTLGIPRGLEGNWNSLPPVRIDFPKSLSYASNHSLSENMGLEEENCHGFLGWYLPPGSCGDG